MCGGRKYSGRQMFKEGSVKKGSFPRKAVLFEEGSIVRRQCSKEGSIDEGRVPRKALWRKVVF